MDDEWILHVDEPLRGEKSSGFFAPSAVFSGERGKTQMGVILLSTDKYIPYIDRYLSLYLRSRWMSLCSECRAQHPAEVSTTTRASVQARTLATLRELAASSGA